jgi:hypothetical protein
MAHAARLPRSRRLWRRSAAAAGAALLALAPRAAEACAVCFSGKTDETRIAFILTTGFLTLMPFVLLGAAAFWLRRRVREHDAAQQAHRDRLGGTRVAAPPRRVRPAGRA